MTSGAVIGRSLAEDHNLNIGSKLTLVSTLTSMTLIITIEGIITTETPIDSELLLPLTTVQALRGINNDFVSFIRVKVDSNIITKTQLNKIVSSEYEVSILVRSHEQPLNDNLDEVSISVYSSTGDILESKNLNSDGRITFSLAFGTYRFIAESESIQQSTTNEFFIDRSFDVPLQFWIGDPKQDLVINVTYNNYPANNASVTVQKKFHPKITYQGLTSADGISTFHDLSIGYYHVTVLFRGFSKSFEVKLNETTSNPNSMISFQVNDANGISVDFVNSFQVEIVNATNEEEINGGLIQLLNSSNPVQVLYPENSTDNQTWVSYNSNERLFIEEPGTYLVNYSIGERTRLWSQSISANTSNKIFVGNGNLDCTVYGITGEITEGVNVSIYLNEEIVDFNFTSTQGTVLFKLETGFSYKIVANYPGNATNVSSTIYFDRPKNIILSFVPPIPIESYWLKIKVFNGTAEIAEFFNLIGCKIDLYNQSGLISTKITDDNGSVDFILNQSGNYFLNASYNDYTWSENISLSQAFTFINIPLGDVKLYFFTTTSSNIPVADTHLKIYSNDILFVEVTSNSSGLAEVFVPVGTYTLIISKLDYENGISLTLNRSQILIHYEVIDLSGILSFRVTTSIGNAIRGARITVRNLILDIEYTGVTIQNAAIDFKDVPWGIYIVTVQIKDAVYDIIYINFAEEQRFILIELGMPIMINDELISVGLRTLRNVEVVESAEYMDSFLGGALEVIKTTFIAFVVIITALSLLNISSVISYPIMTNQRNIKLVKTLGGTFTQIYIMLSLQMILLGLLSSIFGSILGIIAMTNIDFFRSVNIGGLLIYPSFNPIIIVGVAIPNIFIILLKVNRTLNNLI
ncbi:MAG: hypothetical protein ACXAC2_07035 [Candidatus Kariarchaeaceae archaeon]|jgi:hypothetical protein